MSPFELLQKSRKNFLFCRGLTTTTTTTTTTATATFPVELKPDEAAGGWEKSHFETALECFEYFI